MIEKLERPTRLDEDKITALKELFPSVVSDGKINFDALREELSDDLSEVEAGDEHYGLYWSGKRKAKHLAAIPPTGTLIPAHGEGVDEDTTKNLIIEGENLEVLRILQKSYAGRVKLIYIDPPYNTGNDFVYKDDFKEPVESYLERSGQKDENGLLTSNPKSSGRFHSAWLEMMYPRLKIAANLLQDDGAIFISIDDNEAANLRIICDEIMGAENFLAMIAWEKRYTRSNNAKMFYSLKDTILVYRKSAALSFLREPRNEKSDQNYSNPDNDSRGLWTTSSYVNPATQTERPNLVYPIIQDSTGREINHPTHAWKYSRDEHERHKQENMLWWGQSGDAEFPRLKIFLLENQGGLVPIDLWDHKSTGTTDEGGAQLKALFDGAEVFDNPKPTKLIKRVLQLITKPEEENIVLDFFAGSGTTAQAVLEQNFSDTTKRVFICVQLPVATPKSSTAHELGFETISEITKERIRRVSKKLKTEGATGDLGFKVMKLERSNFIKWRTTLDAEEMTMQLGLFARGGTLIPAWKRANVLTEIMLLEGYPLDSSVQASADFLPNNVEIVTHPELGTRLLICLDETPISEEAIDVLEQPEFKKDVFICLERTITDELKARAADRVLRVKAL